MPDCIYINNINEMKLSNDWTVATKFNSKNRVVAQDGKPISASYSGRTFKITQKYERSIPFFERVGRLFLGTVRLMCSFGHAETVRSALALITKNYETVRFAISLPGEIEQKHSGMWACVERIANPSGGYLYRFKANEAYDPLVVEEKEKMLERSRAFLTQQDELYPAIEPSSSSMLIFDPARDEESCLQPFIEETCRRRGEGVNKELMAKYVKSSLSHVSYRNIFIRLGYEASQTKDGTYITMPDREALLARWQELRESQVDLPQLDIISSQGIADDSSFIEAYLRHDVLLSTGKEFIHDSNTHVIAVLTLMLTSGKNEYLTYAGWRSRIVDLIRPEYQRIKTVKELISNPDSGIPKATLVALQRDVPKVEALLSAFVDAIWSHDTYTTLDRMIGAKSLLDQIIPFAANPKYKKYWEGRFGKDQMSSEIIENTWAQIADMAGNTR